MIKKSNSVILNQDESASLTPTVDQRQGGLVGASVLLVKLRTPTIKILCTLTNRVFLVR